VPENDESEDELNMSREEVENMIKRNSSVNDAIVTFDRRRLRSSVSENDNLTPTQTQAELKISYRSKWENIGSKFLSKIFAAKTKYLSKSRKKSNFGQNFHCWWKFKILIEMRHIKC